MQRHFRFVVRCGNQDRCCSRDLHQACLPPGQPPPQNLIHRLEAGVRKNSASELRGGKQGQGSTTRRGSLFRRAMKGRKPYSSLRHVTRCAAFPNAVGVCRMGRIAGRENVGSLLCGIFPIRDESPGTGHFPISMRTHSCDPPAH
ncbi:hypothetical protein BaRGS_00012611 [Batillaria attramentaria]|uniref:Uncharacterized protein n=1 Tax=Batillaria attramentaria TaxID=370345 RepID=A0ABD0LA81_9CAEN